MPRDNRQGLVPVARKEASTERLVATRLAASRPGIQDDLDRWWAIRLAAVSAAAIPLIVAAAIMVHTVLTVTSALFALVAATGLVVVCRRIIRRVDDLRRRGDAR